MFNKIVKCVVFVPALVFSSQVWAQDADTVKQLNEVVVTGYLSRQPIVEVPASVAVLDSKVLLNGSQQTLLPVVNTVPGVRMEERSPGSYRLSIRGSLLRSPFGVRNVKMYLNDLPFTDASGNTYLNLIDPVLLQRVEILKGPDGSLFGANSGGVVLMESEATDSSSMNGSISAGSYGLFREHALVRQTSGKVHWSLGEAYQRSDGYRQQTAMKRLSLFGSGKLEYGAANNVKLTALFSDLQYQTPGGLTKAQYEADPQQARPATPTAPGAVTQQTGIYNTTFFGGLTNELSLSSSLRHILSVFGTYTEYENPFITNYEMRTEKNAGLRTFVEYSVVKDAVSLQAHAGVESQFGFQKISNYGNNQGEPDSLLLRDEIGIIQAVYFSKLSLRVSDRFTTEIAVSLNQYQYRLNEADTRKFSNEWMPRIALSYKLLPELALRASVSRGYSPPTVAEIRPSGGTVNETLEAESGWNKELGVRLSVWNGRLQADASVFRYDLTDAIVRRTGADDTEYFLNAGGTKQNGVELSLNTVIIPEQQVGLVRGMSMQVSAAFSDFYFDAYMVDTEDYSGNRLTGVPASNIGVNLSVSLAQRFNVFVQSFFVSDIPLNDANSEYADHNELMQVKLGWTAVKNKRLMLEFFGGADNILNQHYSLGHDLNSFGGRYYNAAPLRNFYGGLNVRFY